MVDGLILTARLLLSLMFVVAGVAKLADRAGAARAFEEFGAPAKVSPALAIALPVFELGLALGLLSAATVWPSAVGACALLLLFAAVIAVNLARGRTPDCHCFGQIHSAPAGPSTLIRNGVLAAIAGWLAWISKGDPGPSLLDGLARLEGSRGLVLALILVLVLVAGVQSVLLYQLIRQQGRLLLRLETSPEAAAHATPGMAPIAEQPRIGVSVGAQAPHFDLETLDGGSASLEQLLAGYGALLLIFTNPKCGPCSALIPEIAHWGLDESLPAKIVLISEGAIEDNLLKFGMRSDPMVLLQKQRETADAYQASGTPAAVLIGRDGRIASWVMFGADAIRTLVDESPTLLRSLPETPAQTILPASNRKPAGADLVLRDRSGAAFPIDTFSGAPTLLLFWNPSCGFCQQMEADIAAWIAQPPEGAPRLTVVLTNPDAHEREAALSGATILVDADGKAGAAFGARGTPMGVLLDAQSRVASNAAAGAQAVFELLKAATRESTI